MGDLAARLSRLSPEERLLLERRLAAKQARGPVGIPRRKPGEVAPLSFSQKRLWYLEQLNPGTATYNAPYAFRGRGRLDVEALRRAANAVVERHSVLRTRIGTTEAGEATSTVAAAWDVVEVVKAGDEAAAMELLEQAAKKPFDIAKDLMVRVLVVGFGEEEFLLLVAAHHIAWDGVSKGIFFREMSALYDAMVSGGEAGLAEPKIEYADYALWQERAFAGTKREAEVAYWKQKLGGAAPYLDIPLDKPRPAVQRFQGAKIAFELPAELLEGARAFSRAERMSLYATFLAVFKVFLLAFAGQEDVSVATPFAGRDEPDTQEIIGFFTNTVVLRTQMEAAASFRVLAGRVKETLFGAQEHQMMPMDQLVEILQPPRDLNRMPLAQVNFRLQGGKPPAVELRGVELVSLPLIDTSISKFDMALECASVEGEAGYVEYNTDLFSEERMSKVPAAYEALLRAVIAEPEKPVGELAAFRAVGELSPKRRKLGIGGGMMKRNARNA